MRWRGCFRGLGINEWVANGEDVRQPLAPSLCQVRQHRRGSFDAAATSLQGHVMKPLGSLASWFVVVAFVLTASVSASVWRYQETDLFKELTHRYCTRSERIDDAVRKACRIANSIGGYDDEQLRAFATSLVHETNEVALQSLLNTLQKHVPTRSARRLSVFLAEIGGQHWRSPDLMLKAGAEYRLGRYVARDRQKAIGYLTDPLLAADPRAFLELGELYLDPASPYHDKARGLDYMRRSAAGGVEGARERLKELGADEPATSSRLMGGGSGDLSALQKDDQSRIGVRSGDHNQGKDEKNYHQVV